MSGRSSLVASAEQQVALRDLAGSAVLLTLAGWAAPGIAEAFGVGEDTVRRWRHWFARGGVDALRATLAPGPAAERGERALACACELLAVPVQDRPNWTLLRLRAEIEARTGVRVSQGHLSVLLREKGGSAGGGPATA